MDNQIRKRAKALDAALSGMKGKFYKHAGITHKVLEYIINEEEEKVTIKTSHNSFVRYFDSMDEFLKYWEPADAHHEIAAVTYSVPKEQVTQPAEDAVVDRMISILEDNITKVQKDAGYINQAKAINNNVNSVINIVKMKMTFHRNMKKN